MSSTTPRLAIAAAFVLILSACGAGEPASSPKPGFAVAPTTTATPEVTIAVATTPGSQDPADTVSDGAPSTTTAAPLLVSTTTTSTVPSTTMPPGVLAYGFGSIDELSYILTMNMTMDVNIEGGEGLEGFEDFDGPMRTDMDMEMPMALTFGPGLGAGTHEVTQTIGEVEFLRMSVEGGGESFELTDSDAIAAASGEDAVPLDGEVIYIIDESGAILSTSVDGVELAQDLFGGQPGLGSFNGAQLFGPPLPGGDAAIGDTWSSTMESEFLPGQPLVTTLTSTLVDILDDSGAEIYVIETISETPAVAFSIADLLTSEDLGVEDELAMGLLEGFDLSYSMSPTVTTSTVWFNQASGLTERNDVATSLSMEMVMGGLGDLAPEAPEGPITMMMDMTMTMSIELVG